MKDLRGTTAIVTGASRGIGVYIAQALAKEGVNLSLAARSEAELETVRTEMAALGLKAIATRCDVTNADDRAQLIERTETELGPVDLLVNNAGIETAAHFDTAPPDDLVQTLEVNLVAAMLLTRSVLPGMLQRKRGHVVNIASGAGKVGVPFAVAYATSKHGLVGLTNSLRCEYLGSPVGFSVVCPGFVNNTGMYARWEAKGATAPKIVGRSSPERVAQVVVSCIHKNRGEVLVNKPPLRPLIVLFNAAPRVMPRAMKLFGYTRTFERITEIAGRT
ncbi:MAG: SDR family oxidoreductase [Ilumatobacteraceae bacterium]|nr:SDR family oxidoreductase [Ilumatobacteraceae bacterium]